MKWAKWPAVLHGIHFLLPVPDFMEGLFDLRSLCDIMKKGSFSAEVMQSPIAASA